MKLLLKHLQIDRLGEEPGPIEGMSSRDYLNLWALVELELAGRKIDLVTDKGRWLPLHGLCANLRQLLNWLKVPDSQEVQFVTHVTGGYRLKFRLASGRVAVEVSKRGKDSPPDSHEELDAGQLRAVVAAFKRQLRSQLLERVDRAIANDVWEACFILGLDEDPIQ